MTKREMCIYCGREINLDKHKGDHIIPARLGEFKNSPLFTKICKSCNNAIGKSEEQLYRCGPERLFRDIVIPSSKRSRGKTSSWSVGAAGAPPPKIRMFHPDVGMIDAEKQVGKIEDSQIFDQVIFYDENDAPNHQAINVNMSDNTIIKLFQDHFVKEPVDFIVDPRNIEFYRDIMNKLFGAKFDWDKSLLPGEYNSLIRFRVNDHYFRAIAKIAFHYFLVNTNLVIGNEISFSSLRNFIINGGNPAPFFNVTSPYLIDMDLVKGGRIACAHLLSYRVEKHVITASVQLFRGLAQCNTHYIYLGILPYVMVIPSQFSAHLYKYYSEFHTRKMAGEVKECGHFTLRRNLKM